MENATKTVDNDRDIGEDSTTEKKSHFQTLERLHWFTLPSLKKKSEKNNNKKVPTPSGGLIKGGSIGKLLGSKIVAKKPELKAPQTTLCERFSSLPEDEIDGGFPLNKSRAQSISSLQSSISTCSLPSDKTNLKSIKTITKGFVKLLRRNCDSVAISPPDPEYKVFYLGNVLTGWAKGDACVEKPLATLWRNYIQNNKPEVLMRLEVAPSGLKATTRQHGLTEYWSHRITFCSSLASFPKIFCWIYRHEGRKMKHEFRCHAVICSKESHCQEITTQLKDNLKVALREFKREKVNKQNARLSLAHATEDNPSMPRRKILLSTGTSNYRPPLERSKSAPKLFAIEEMIDEEDEVIDESEKVVVKNCCKEDYLYPSITLGRRRCRRGHSIRRPRLLRTTSQTASSTTIMQSNQSTETLKEQTILSNKKDDAAPSKVVVESKPTALLGSDEDFESFLMHQNYDMSTPLIGEIITYLDMDFMNTSDCKNAATSSMGDLIEPGMFEEQSKGCISMIDLLDYESDIGLRSSKSLSGIYFDRNSHETISNEIVHESHQPFVSMTNDTNDIVECRNDFIFKRPIEDFEKDFNSEIPFGMKRTFLHLNSDEGSSSSNSDETSSVKLRNPRRGSVLDRVKNFEMMASGRSKQSPTDDKQIRPKNFMITNGEFTRNGTLTSIENAAINELELHHEYDSDEMSDESGFVEFQDLSLKSVFA